MNLVKPFISLLARLGGMEPQYIPYGLAGDRMPYSFACTCFHIFVTHLSLFNEEKVTCPNCGAVYLIANDGARAWFLLMQSSVDLAEG